MTQLRDQLQAALTDAYQLERELGGGGMSRVFLATESRLDRKVVVKLLSPDLAHGLNADRFLREIRLAASLQQANIVPVLTAGDMEGLPYYTMPYVEGESLRARFTRGPLPLDETVGILRDVARALTYAHARGIVHRDIKPDNVLLSGGTAVVTDFGIAKAISVAKTHEGGATLTQMGTSIGTPMYMAPEQAAGDPDIDHRADIYSFGCMAYEMIAGRPPFVAKTPQRLLAAHMAETPQSLAELRSDLPTAMVHLVMQCLAKDAEARPQTVAQMLPVLESTSSGDGTAAPGELRARTSTGRALLLYVAAFIAVAIVARAAVIALGLPDWAFTGAIVVMALGLPVVLFTGYAQSVARRAFTATPTFTPGGTPSATHGTMATFALKASPHLSWKRTARGGTIAFGAFALLVAGAMSMRAAGIGPFATLFTAGALTGGDRIVVAELAVPPGTDSALGRVIAEAVKTDLSQSTAIDVVDDGEVQGTLLAMQRAGARMVFPVAREVAVRRGAKAIVDGTITPIGGGFLVKLRVVSSDSSKELASVTEGADSPSELIPVVGKLTKELRRRMGESLKSVRATPDLGEVATTSLEALRKYADGREALYMRADRTTFVRLMREAIAIDSNFAGALGTLAVELNSRGGAEEEVQRLVLRAHALNDRMSVRDRLWNDVLYYRNGPVAERDFSRVAAALDSLRPLVRRNYGLAQWFALNARDRGDFAYADSMFRVAVADSASSYGLSNLFSFQRSMGRRAAADSVGREYIARYPTISGWVVAELQRDSGNVSGAMATLQRDFDRDSRDPFARNAAAGRLSRLAADRGMLRDHARWQLAAAAAQAERGVRDAAISARAEIVVAEVEAGRNPAASLRALDSVATPTIMNAIPALERPYVELAIAYAATGRIDRAKAMVAGIAQQEREDDPRRGRLIKVPRALVAMSEKRWDDAVTILRGTFPGNCPTCVYRARGLAFDGAGQADSAIYYYAEAVRPLSTRGVETVVTHRRLGELYEARQDRMNALIHYRRFVDAWTQADPELKPQVDDVRRRIARLEQEERRGR